MLQVRPFTERIFLLILNNRVNARRFLAASVIVEASILNLVFSFFLFS